MLSVLSMEDLGSASRIGTGGLTLNGGTFQYTGGTNFVNRGLTMAGAGSVDITNALMTLGLDGVVTGAGTLTKIGDGTLFLRGFNSYSGGTVVSGGTLRVANLANLGQNSTVGTGGITLNGGILRYSGGTVSVNRGLILVGAGEVNVSSSSITVTLGDALTGAGSLTKSGDGTLALSNASNDYSGGTTISAGTLRVNGSLATASGVAVNGGTLSGNGSIGGSVTLASGAIIAPGVGLGALTIGSLTVNNGAILTADIGSAVTNDSDKLLVTGSANSGFTTDVMAVNIIGNVTGYSPGVPVSYVLMDATPASSLTTTNFALSTTGITSDLPGTWSFAFSEGDLIVTFAPVPEPVFMMGFAAVWLGLARRIQRRV